MGFRFSRRAVLLASLSTTMLSPGAAMAQGASDAGADDEIIVTAQKREENL